MPSKETRSLVEIGSKNRSGAITLPKPWLDFWKMKKKAKISIVYDSILVVIPPGYPDKEGIEEKVKDFLLEK
ncbi:MAG TPA: hypothetical protein ENG66_08440 [Thermococcus sp.]|nr:hypothetical protein [Thermococcus sp.]